MSGKQSKRVTMAMRLVIERGYRISDAARKHGAESSSVQRAMRRAGYPPRQAGRPRGT